MKKVGLMIGCIILISVLGVSFVSANWFVDLFTVGEEGTGEGFLATLSGDEVISSECIDSDGGENYYELGYVDLGTEIKQDICWEDGKNLREYVCEDGVYKGDVSYSCPQGCEDGACVFINDLNEGECYDGCHGKIFG